MNRRDVLEGLGVEKTARIDAGSMITADAPSGTVAVGDPTRVVMKGLQEGMELFWRVHATSPNHN